MAENEKEIINEDKCEEIPVVLMDENEECTRESELLDSLKRITAEFDNYRKRNAEISKSSREEGKREVIISLLPIMDSFTQARALIKDKSVLEGIDLIFKQLTDVLGKLSVREINAVGQPFDPNLHEAVHIIDDEKNAGRVVEIFQNGYMLGNNVLRHAKVIIAK